MIVNKNETMEEMGDGKTELGWYDLDANFNKDIPFLPCETINQILETEYLLDTEKMRHLKISHAGIIAFYEMYREWSDREDFIRSIFSNAFTELFIGENHVRVGYKAYQNRLFLWEGSYLNRTKETSRVWMDIAEHFDSLIRLGRISDTGTSSSTGDVPFFTRKVTDVFYTCSLSKSRFSIYHQFKKRLSSKENIEFLKSFYGLGYRSHIQSGLGVGVYYNSKGVDLVRWIEHRQTEKHFIPWKEVEERFEALISHDEFLTPNEKAEYSRWIDEENTFIEHVFIDDKLEDGLDTTVIMSEDEPHDASIESVNYEPLVLNPTRKEPISKPTFEGQMTIFDLLNLTDEFLMPDAVSLQEEESVTLAENSILEVEEFAPEIISILEVEEDATEEASVLEVEEIIPEDEDALEIEEIAPPPFLPEKEKVSSHNICPDVPESRRHQYSITDNNLGVGTPREKFRANIAAIQLVKSLSANDELAVIDEQDTLSKYVGWGGLADVFDVSKTEWESEHKELKALLTEKEYASARESALTAFYTPPIVIAAIYRALERFGFTTGNILEPAVGTGNFIGMLPESMKDSKVYGVEIDSITGRIAQQLYQKSTIAVQGFEDYNASDNFFDVIVGNVPFGDFGVADIRYDKHNLLIHDYFFAKAIDKVRPGGIIAFITSKGTMDKKNTKVRKYIASRAELIGAIRLPNNTFTKNAGTSVTSDILFLQKRDGLNSGESDWINVRSNNDGIEMNEYFVDNPYMILGEMKLVSGRFGEEPACLPSNEPLDSLLSEAIECLDATITMAEVAEEVEAGKSIPADPDVRNFSFTLVKDYLFYRENSVMTRVEGLPKTTEQRVRGMLDVRDCVRRLITLQANDYPSLEILEAQKELNTLYDSFVKKHGRITSQGNRSAFELDSSYTLLCALEVLDEHGKFVSKADMFTKRTIRPKQVITSVETSSEALSVSLASKAKVDMEYMMDLTGKTEEEIYNDLMGVIFIDHSTQLYDLGERTYLSSDEYLSGNVRQKLKQVQIIIDGKPDLESLFKFNLELLEKALPEYLSAAEISVRLGATWIEESVVNEFIEHLFEIKNYDPTWDPNAKYSSLTSKWQVDGYLFGNVHIRSTYGTPRANALKIMEDSLNLVATKIYDSVDNNGKKTYVLNKQETAIAQSKQELINQAFKVWIWECPKRRAELEELYNNKFNAIRPREYDGSSITFEGMNADETLQEHQVNAVARIIYGGNTLLGHVVGAGKTWEMVAAAMEMKRLGLCHKSLIVVPNHIIDQWGAAFLQLYPSANLLVARKKDFETRNRKKFCARIATGDYDAIIIGHSQFVKIPLSKERRQANIESEIDDITKSLKEIEWERGKRFSIKQMETVRKKLLEKLKKLEADHHKDDVVTFEELGVDRLFIDESHYFKNLHFFTKMSNVAGIPQTDSQRSSDLFHKCRYLDEITGYRGVIFATGTPISNSMAELYTIQRYLQYHKLEELGLEHFDAWASTFGETETVLEIAPEGVGFKARTRFSKFYNLPELMSIFREIADIKTADMLNLPTPKANFETVVAPSSRHQKDLIDSLVKRAEIIRNSGVSPDEDNMLKVTHDGRKLALDQRVIDALLPDYDESKVNACVQKVFEIWQSTTASKSSQLIFSDLSTPKKDATFSIYTDIRSKLEQKGIPSDQIAFIHDANTDVRKKELFAKVRSGAVRVLLGSTLKMGAGTNIQDRLIATHDLDVPWRPSDLEQRAGRIIRPGNNNKEITIYRYVTKETFDSYMYQTIENKQRFISQIMTSKSPVRVAEDVDEQALSFAEIKMLATGDPRIKEKMELDIQVSKLKLLRQSHMSQRYRLESELLHDFPVYIKNTRERLDLVRKDAEFIATQPKSTPERFYGIILMGRSFVDKVEAAERLIEICKSAKAPEPKNVGSYRGFDLFLRYDSFSQAFVIQLKKHSVYDVQLGRKKLGNFVRIDDVLNNLDDVQKRLEIRLDDLITQQATAEAEVIKPFLQEAELKEKTKRLDELNILLNMDMKADTVIELPAIDSTEQKVA